MFNVISDRARRRRSRLLMLGVIVAGALTAFLLTNDVCYSLWFRGVSLPYCPEGDILPEVEIAGATAARGVESEIRVAVWAVDSLAGRDSACITRGAMAVSLVAPDGTEQPLLDDGSLERTDCWRRGRMTLPKSLPDGDYLIRARAHTSFGDSHAEARLPLYAPASVHVITDRPLYQPGDTMQFRALIVRARDLVPLDHRPGTWVVKNPSQEVVMEKPAPAGEWGVSTGRFTLDTGAEVGAWTIEWTSGASSQQVSVNVAPFELPRFHVEAKTDKPFYRPGEKPKLTGAVMYSSGAPVADARVALTWASSGAWPLPTEWLGGELPTELKTDRKGQWSAELPGIPGDLIGRASLVADVAATDAAGDTVHGSAGVLLSQDGLQVETVTELGNGLVGGFNNRIFLRAFDPAGIVLANTHLTVKRAWDPLDKGMSADTDADGVAQLQIDPGPPVNVLRPLVPIRKPAPAPLVSRSATNELISGEASLADQRAMDGWLTRFASCSRFVADTSVQVNIGFRADPSGRITDVIPVKGAVEECLNRELRPLRLPAGRDRIYSVGLLVSPSPSPRIKNVSEGFPWVPDPVKARLEAAVADARECVRPVHQNTELSNELTWRVHKESRRFESSWVATEKKEVISADALACVKRKFAGLDLELPSDIEATGVLDLTIEAETPYAPPIPEAQTVLGYELTVLASKDDKNIGATRVVVEPGAVPRTRLRATPIIAQAGGDVTIELIRGPDFHDHLPKKLTLFTGQKDLEVPVDPANRKAVFHLPSDADGWMTARWDVATARVFVPPHATLSVSVRPDHPSYAPGQTAHLEVRTTSGDREEKAAVGLFGVDNSLADVAALPGPDSLDHLRPKVTMAGQSFASLNGQALALGRVRGENAAAAIVLQVASTESASLNEAPASFEARADVDADTQRVDTFYGVLAELQSQVREWDRKTAASVQMHPATMAKLWKRALDACEKRGERTTDAFHRRLDLRLLPPELLALTAPRIVVTNGVRLPEDVEDWEAYVAREKP